MARDPVCGMTVDEKTSTLKANYGGKTYYFCSPGCQRNFVTNPTKYA